MSLKRGVQGQLFVCYWPSSFMEKKVLVRGDGVGC